MNNEVCIEFLNSNNEILRGILHNADEEKNKNISLIFLNTGLNDMVGWHRLQVKMARYFAKNGFNVLRFDNFGIGDSDGFINEEEVAGIMVQIEQGLWAGDAISALEYMIENFNGDKYYFFGFCGGALNAIHAAAVDKRVHGVVDVAAPVALSAKIEKEQQNPYHIKQNIQGYKRKLLNIKSVTNFFTGRSEYGKLIKSIYYYIKHRKDGFYSKNKMDENIVSEKININHSLFESFDNFIKSKRHILFYYPEFDTATWEFKNFFTPKYKDNKNWQNYTKFIELKNANHIFSDEDSQKQIKEDILKWFNEIKNYNF